MVGVGEMAGMAGMGAMGVMGGMGAMGGMGGMGGMGRMEWSGELFGLGTDGLGRPRGVDGADRPQWVSELRASVAALDAMWEFAG